MPDSSESGSVPSRPDPVERGLAEAFGASSLAGMSVLRTLQARAKSRLGVHLDSQGLDDVLVKITDEARSLRDPSGRYQVLGEIGSGGVGTVYKGRDTDLGRDVAMKVLRDEFADRPDVLARFVEEAQIGGQLQHPGIVPVYELGLQAGERPYFAMKLVKGETLAAQLARRGDPARDRRRLLGVFEQVCQTIAYAHARRVVHRDLKPANVMIGAFGEVQVVDWGFAKVLPRDGTGDEAGSIPSGKEHSVIETVRSRTGSRSTSVAGAMLGTPAYMPPEQALGDIARVDRRSDVFALGAILCEILTGAPPYREKDGDLVLQASTAALDGALERLGACSADESLVALSKACLAPSRRARPESAAEVAERICQYLTSVEERAQKAELRAAEARYKNRVTVLASAAALLLLALGSGTWIWLQHEAQARRAEVTQQVANQMNATSRALGTAQAQARDGVIDVALWDAADQRAESLELLLKSSDVEREVREQADELLDQVAEDSERTRTQARRQARDAAMLERLEVLRMPTDDDVRAQGWVAKERRRLDTAYAEAFATYLGVTTLLEQPTESVLMALRHGDIEVELATSLDHWALVRDGISGEQDPPDPTGTARIRALAARLDPDDPWRTELRALLPDAAPEADPLRALADRADFAAMTAAGCRVLSEALWHAGEKEASMSVLRRGQELHPQDFDLCFRLAVGLEQLEEPRWQEAMATYRIAHALKPERNETLHRQALALEQLGRHADAERLFRVLLVREPQRGHWCYHVAKALAKQGNLGEAIESYRRAIELEPQFAEAHYNFGIALARHGKLDEAVESYRRAIEIDPRYVWAHGNLGNTLLKQGKLDQAVESYRRAIEIDPRDALAHYNLGNTLAKQGKLDQAIESFRLAIEIDPQYVAAHHKLGIALRKQGKLDQAIESYRRATEIDPRYSPAHYNLGNALGKQGKLDQAIESYRRAIEIDPRYAPAHCNLGNAVRRQGRLDEAIESYQRATGVDPRYAPAHYNLGSALAEQGKLDQAIESYRRAIEIRPRHAHTHGSLGNALAAQGKLDQAIESYQRAIQIDPRDAVTHYNLSIALKDQGLLEEAIESCRRAIEIDPRQALAYSNMGDALFFRGDSEEALTAYRKAAELFARQDSAFARRRSAIAREQILRIELLENILIGRQRAGSSEDWAAAVETGYRQQRYREIVALTERTLQSAPELIGGEYSGIYNSACAAALLAADPAGKPDVTEHVHMRGLARAWLVRVVGRWTGWVREGGEHAAEARRLLAHALHDPDFASVRGDALERLPDDERAAWRALWTAVEHAARENGR